MNEDLNYPRKNHKHKVFLALNLMVLFIALGVWLIIHIVTDNFALAQY